MKFLDSTVTILRLFIFSSVMWITSCDSITNKDTQLVRLNIETYLAGKNQTTHPSVISFEREWHGYKYWMAHSPYPYAYAEEENPCVAVSNDMYYWDTPIGLANPIATNEEVECDELKDPHLLYRPDLDRLEIWYLGRLSKKLGGDGEQLLLFRKTSENGVAWSKYEVMSPINYLSQSIIWEDGHYTMWAIGFGAYKTQGTFVKQISYDGKVWSKPVACSIEENSKDLKIWHGSVSFFDNKYNFVYIDGEKKNTDVYCCESTDGIHFSRLRSIKHNDEGWNRFYRPFLMKDKDCFYLLYGTITDNNAWYISMSHGADIDDLNPIEKNDIERMIPLSDSVDNDSVRSWLQLVKNRFRFELFVLIPCLCILFKLTKRWSGIFWTTVLLIEILLFTIYRFGTFRNISATFVAALITAVSIYCVTIQLYQRVTKKTK